MENRLFAIAGKLAIAELKLSDEDLKDQAKLKILLVKQNEILEEVKLSVIQTIATIAKDYPNEDINELEVGVVTVLEKKVETGEITSTQAMYSADTQKAISSAVITQHIYNESMSVSVDKGVTDVAVGMNFVEFINKDMSKEAIKQFEKQYRESPEYQEAVIADMDKIFEANTQEEKEDAAKKVKLRDLSIKSSDMADRHEEHKGSKLYNVVAIANISRMAMTNDPELIKEAIILAKKTGMDSLIKPNRTIDLDLAYKAMLEEVKHDPKVAQRYSTKEKFIEYLEKKNQRDARVMAKKMDENVELKEQYQTAKTQEEKMEFLRGDEQKRVDRKQIMAGLRSAIHTKNREELQTRMAELAENNPKWAKEILLRFASGENTAQPIQAEIISFVNERYAAKEEKNIETDTPKVTVKSTLEDSER